MASIIIIYSTTGGNTEITIEKVAEVLSSENNDVTVKQVENATISDFFQHDLCILACPTYGHGILPANFESFYQEIKETDLKNTKYAIIGLGDYKYDIDYHLESVNILEKVINNNHGNLIYKSLRISKSPIKFLETSIPKWALKLSETINNE